MTTAQPADVLFVLRELAAHMRPCFVHRHNGVTVVLMDPRSTRIDSITWIIDNLTVDERNIIRVAHGEPPIPGRLSDECVSGFVRPIKSMVVQERRKPTRHDEVRATRERSEIVRKRARDLRWTLLSRRMAM